MPRKLELALLGNRALQGLVRRNFVCFPAQAPVFGQRSRRDVQWRLAVLYFVRGWSTKSIADRYGLTRERCGQIISDWRIRAVTLGYIQDVTPEGTDLGRLAEYYAAAPVAPHRAGADIFAGRSATASFRSTSTGSVVPAKRVAPSASVEATAPGATAQAATAVAENPTISRTSAAISPGGRLPSILR